MVFKLIIVIVPFIIPYMIIGENLGNLILSFIATIFLILNKEKISINKKYFYTLIFLNIIAVVSLFISDAYLESISGLSSYFNLLVYYLVLSVVLKDKEKILKNIVLVVSVVCIYSIIVQGLYFDTRIYGNIGYANSYGLVLLISFYLNKIRIKDIWTSYVDMILILGIFFTGSRTTLVLLGVFLVAEVIKEIRISKILAINILEPFLFALIQYVIYSAMGIMSILVMPVITYLYSIVRSLKWKQYIYLVGLVIVILLIVFSDSNTMARIRNISFTNGSFQERLVYFEDSMAAIKRNPLGNGINMFQYKQYGDSTAYYDVKYIHNSVLQISYDIGIIGAIVFIALLIIGIVVIIKGTNKRLLVYGYITIFLHSLIDFDFAYSTIGLLFVMIVLLSENGDKDIYFKVSKVILVILLLIVTYLNMFEGSLAIAKIFSINNNSSIAIRFYNISDKIRVIGSDHRGYYGKAEVYKKIYDDTNDISKLEESLSLLMKAEKINEYDPRVTWNLAYIYINIGDDKNAIKYMDKMIEQYRFYNGAYDMYCEYLKRRYIDTGNLEYKNIQNRVEKYKDVNLKKLNFKSKYMNNQLK